MVETSKTGFVPREWLTEKQVVRVWRSQLIQKAGLATEDGIPLEVFYPGRPNDDRGADFRDAVLSANRNLLRGDVEIHVRSSDWRSHGHDRDSAYNRVILHVVMKHDCHGSTVLENGRRVPVLALEKYLHFDTPGPTCQNSGPAFTASFLDRAGESRFREKAAQFRRRLQQTDAAQVLYEGIMEALGYAKNKTPFLKLAERVPLTTVAEIVTGTSPNGVCVKRLQRLFLHEAGRINSWNTFKVRPSHFPEHRIAALSHLLVRYRERGLLESLTGIVSQESESKKKAGKLEQAFMVAAGIRTGSNITLLGREQAAVIVINVVLPFGYAWGQMSGEPDLTQKSLDVYRKYPRRVSNSIESHMMNQLGLNGAIVNSARRQQGLIHVYKNLCVRGKCPECDLSQLEAGEGVQV